MVQFEVVCSNSSPEVLSLISEMWVRTQCKQNTQTAEVNFGS